MYDCMFPFMTLVLLQDDVPGLEVKLASGVWVQAPVIPGMAMAMAG
jgi:isopenicillin N synthase-like dioxygenase